MKTNNSRLGLAAAALLLLAARVAYGQGYTYQATQTTLTGYYTSPGTLTFNCQFAHDDPNTFYAFLWCVVLPDGWSVTSATGGGFSSWDIYYEEGGPEEGWAYEVPYYALSPNGTTTQNPISFSFTVSVPSGSSGQHDIIAKAYYWFDGMIDLGQVIANPDPLELREYNRVSGYVFHEATPDGVRDPGIDEGVTNITVFLLAGGTETRLGRSDTDSAGHYAFDGVTNGTYDLEFWVNTNKLTTVPTEPPDSTSPERNRLPVGASRLVGVTLADGADEQVNVGLTDLEPFAIQPSLRLFRSGGLTYVEFETCDEAMAGQWIVVLLRRPGLPDIELARVESQGGDNLYTLVISDALLDLAGGNTIVVVDEMGREHVYEDVRVSCLAVRGLRLAGSGWELSWSGEPGAVYDILRAADLGGPWVPVVSNVVADGELGLASVPIDPAVRRAFFRIVQR